MNPFETIWRRWARSVSLLGVLAIVLLGVGVLSTSCGRQGQRAGAAADQQYHCPMHPTYVADRAGDCPICGMKLVPMNRPGGVGDSAGAQGARVAEAGPRRILHYRNPMNPAVTSPVPLKDEMGMDYVPVYSDEVAQASAVDGHAIVELRPGEVELTGIQTVLARRGSLSRTIRTVGEVKADEARVRHVHTKVAGWVEKLFVNSSGQVVRRGQPLLSLYSPELLATQEEFVRALESGAQFEQSDVEEVRRGGRELVASARRRLLSFDLPQTQIAQLERTRQPQRAVTLDAPVSGFVSSKEVFEGMQVDPGTTLFTVTDLSRVWVEAEIYEYEAGLVRLGQKATLTLPNTPGRRYSARISYLYPYLDAETRTLRVRFEFDNPGQVLKPGMYADVELQGEATDGVLIPDAALMDTGVRKIVYVQTGPGRFEPRLVTVGSRGGGDVRVISGVKAGEAVVTQANFLLDSESRLRYAIAGSTAPDTSRRNTP